MALAFIGASRCLTAQGKTADHGVIRGIVLDTLRRPYPNVVVQLHLSVTLEMIRDTSRSFVRDRSDTTDADGRFEFTALGPFVYSLAFYQGYLISGGAGPVEIRGPTDTVSVELRSNVRRPLYETPDSVRERRLAELAEARARWEANRTANYSFIFQIDCFCIAPTDAAKLEFRNDTIVRVMGQRVRHNARVVAWYNQSSVPALFKQVEDAIRDRHRRVEAVEYDATYGFPKRLDTETAYWATDLWHRWRVTDFRPMK